MTETALAEPGANDLTHEGECQRRIGIWDTELKGLIAKSDLAALQALKAAIDAQLALEQLRITVRQADWPKLTTWGPLIVPFFGGILGALIGARLK